MKVWALLKFLRGAVTSVSLRIKIMGIVLLITFLMGSWVTLQVRWMLERSLGEQLDSRAIAIARGIASRSADPILTNNLYALYELARDTLENNRDVRYVFFVDSRGEVLVHTFGGVFPRDLLLVNRPSGSMEYQMEILDTEDGLVHDVAVPIFGGRAGFARVGMVERGMRQEIARITGQLLAVTALASLIGVVLGYLMTSVLTIPVRELVRVTGEVAAGNLRLNARIWADDEIGKLSAAFNSMIEELRRKEEMRTQLLDKVITAQEEERQRIARELHDETSQSLTSLMIGLKLLETAASGGELREKAAELRELAAKTLKEVHRLAVQLRPSVLDDFGLVAALERHVEEFSENVGLNVGFHVEGFEGKRLLPQAETALYRVIQEALTNVAKHASASSVDVLLEHRGNMVVAIVEDDGKGFDVPGVMGEESRHNKLGLYGMQERVSLIGGTIAFESTPGSGTTVIVQVPLEGSATG